MPVALGWRISDCLKVACGGICFLSVVLYLLSPCTIPSKRKSHWFAGISALFSVPLFIARYAISEEVQDWRLEALFFSLTVAPLSFACQETIHAIAKAHYLSVKGKLEAPKELYWTYHGMGVCYAITNIILTPLVIAKDSNLYRAILEVFSLAILVGPGVYTIYQLFHLLRVIQARHYSTYGTSKDPNSNPNSRNPNRSAGLGNISSIFPGALGNSSTSLSHLRPKASKPPANGTSSASIRGPKSAKSDKNPIQTSTTTATTAAGTCTSDMSSFQMQKGMSDRTLSGGEKMRRAGLVGKEAGGGSRTSFGMSRPSSTVTPPVCKVRSEAVFSPTSNLSPSSPLTTRDSKLNLPQNSGEVVSGNRNSDCRGVHVDTSDERKDSEGVMEREASRDSIFYDEPNKPVRQSIIAANHPNMMSSIALERSNDTSDAKAQEYKKPTEKIIEVKHRRSFTARHVQKKMENDRKQLNSIRRVVYLTTIIAFLCFALICFHSAKGLNNGKRSEYMRERSQSYTFLNDTGMWGMFLLMAWAIWQNRVRIDISHTWRLLTGG